MITLLEALPHEVATQMDTLNVSGAARAIMEVIYKVGSS